jgi:hypothetical protein
MSQKGMRHFNNRIQKIESEPKADVSKVTTRVTFVDGSSVSHDSATKSTIITVTGDIADEFIESGIILSDTVSLK